MPGKELDSVQSESSKAGTSRSGSTNGKSAAAPESDIDSPRDSPKNWKREDRSESMRSGSGRSLASLGSKGDSASIAESTASGGIEVGKEAKEKKDKSSSWVKTIGMRTLRLRKNKDPEKSQSRLSISSALSLDRPSKSKNKSKSEKKDKNDEFKNTDASSVTPGTSSSTNSTFTSNHKSGENVKDNESIYSATSSKNGSVARDAGNVPVSNSSAAAAPGQISDKQDPSRFLGEGLLFKGKLIGVLEVSGPRGDRICQEALSELKMAVKAAGEHKQKITIHIALDGLRIRDEKTGDCLYHHQVHKISFIAQDLTDARAFGYIFGSPDTGHRFFGIKTEKSASQVVIAMRDLFQVVFDLKKKEIERAKQQLEMQQKFLATRAAETAPTTKTEPKFSIAETYIEGAGAVGGIDLSVGTSNPSAPAEVDLLNLEVELNSLQEGLDNIHTNLVDSAPFRGSTASISSDPINPMPMPKLSTGSISNNTPIPTSTFGGDPFGDSFDPFDGGAVASGSTPAFSSSAHRYSYKTGISEASSVSLHQQQTHVTSFSNAETPLTFTSDPFAQIDPFPGPKYQGDGEFFNSDDPFDSPSGQFSFAYPNSEFSKKTPLPIDKTSGETEAETSVNKKSDLERENATASITAAYREKYGDGWVASFEDNFVPESEGNGIPMEDLSKAEMDIFTELDPLGIGRIRPFVDRKDFFQNLRQPPKKNLKDLGSGENPAPNSSSSSSLVAENNVVNSTSIVTGGLYTNTIANNNVEQNTNHPPKLQLTDTAAIPNSFSTNFAAPSINEIGDSLPLKTPPTSASSRSSSIRMRLHSENSRSESPPNYSPPPPPHLHHLHFSSTSSIGSVGGMGAATNSEYMTTAVSGGGGMQLPFLPPPSSILGTPPSSRFTHKKSPQLLKQMTIAGSTATTAMSSPKTLPRPSSSGGRERKLTAESQSSAGTEEFPNLTPPPRPPHTTNTLGKSVSLSTAVPRPSSGVDRLRNLSGMSSLSGNTPGVLPPEPPPRPLQTTTISSSGFTSQLSPALVSPPPPLPPKKQNFGSVQSSPLNLFSNSSNNTKTSVTEFGKNMLQKINSGNDSSNDLPLPLPSRKSQLSASSSHPHHATVGSRYSVPLSSISPSVQRKEVGREQSKSPVASRRNPPVEKLTMGQALHQVSSMSLGDLARKLELPVGKLSCLTIQQLAEKLTLMDFEQKMEQRERELSQYGSVSQLQQQQREVTVSTASSSRESAITNNDNFGFEDDFSTASAPPDFGEREKSSHHHHHHHHSKKEEFDKYAVFRELSIEDASGFSIIPSLGSNLNKPMSDFSTNSEDEDVSRAMDKTLTNKDSSSERTIQADGTGENKNNHTKDRDASFSAGMANTMDDITDANLSDDDGKFPFDDDEDISPSSNFNTKPAEWATFDSNFDDQFATTSLVKAVDGEDANASPWDSDEGGDSSQKAPSGLASTTIGPVPVSPFVEPQNPTQLPSNADNFDFEPFQKPSQPASAINYSLPVAEPLNSPQVPPVPMRRKLSKENGGIQPPGGNQPLSPDLLRSPVSKFQRQSSGSSKHSGKSVEEPSMGRGSDYSESGGRNRHRGENPDEDSNRWEREREMYDKRRRRNSRENFGRSDSKDSYSSLTRGKYRDGRGGDSEEEYVPSKSTSSRQGRNSNVRPSSSKRSSEREGDPEDDREEEEDTRSYASYHSNYSTSGRRRHRRYPQKYHHHYSSSQRRRDRERSDRPIGQAAGSGHSSLSPERYSHHESDFDNSYEEEGGVQRKKDLYAREREYAERHYHRPRPSSGSGYHHQTGKRYNRDSPRHSDPYYRDRYYRGERSRRKYDDDLDDGREYSEYSGEEEHYHSRHGGHRRRHRGRDEYYREREPQRHRHYYTNSPSWDSESGPEPTAASGGVEKNEKGHRPSSAKYGSEHGSSRYGSPPHSTSSRPNSGRRESGGRYFQSEQPSLSGNGHHSKRPQSGNSVSGKMREYRFEDDFGICGESNNKPSDPVDTLGEKMTDCKIEEGLSMSQTESNTLASPVISETIDTKLTQPQSPFEDNFVFPSNGRVNAEANAEGEVKVIKKEGGGGGKEASESELANDQGNKIVKDAKRNQQQIFFPTKFESEYGEEVEEPLQTAKLSGVEGIVEERDIESSPETMYAPPTASVNSIRGNFTVYSSKRLESIRSEEEKSNEDSVSESALTGSATNANSNMKKSDSFNIFQPAAQDPFADDDFFS